MVNSDCAPLLTFVQQLPVAIEYLQRVVYGLTYLLSETAHMRTFYEQQQGQLTTAESIATAPDGTTTTISSDIAAFFRTAVKYAPVMADFSNSDFYFLDGSAKHFDAKGKHSDLAGLDADQIKRTSLLIKYDLQGATLADAITKLEKLSEEDRLPVILSLFGVRYTLSDPPQKKSKEKGTRDTAPKVNAPDKATVQKVVEFLKERIALFDAGDVEQGKYSAKDAYEAINGSARAVTPLQKSVATVHKAITGHELPGANIKTFFDADNIQAIRDGVAKVEKEGVDQFADRLITAAKAAQGSPLKDFTM
ncbi:MULTISPECIES: hypothetical protein [unclassified Leclercia]|uniref:Substrate of the Dot/Icm secretion system n=1 Tax=Leclercia barmai TaxID=2785629 RepID=A0ABS7RVP5_9ENTR|nr:MULTISPECIES: hypothetical protein [unclassified Leclercia]MBZ0057469.1 hypothetical protein [Leclercia sp. EMC7]MCM5695633.1 hypothetical protein [Leclercia sp. LTM01]MCM5700041.1 hypothetical protein [Leclercia sp. LTM14]